MSVLQSDLLTLLIISYCPSTFTRLHSYLGIPPSDRNPIPLTLFAYFSLLRWTEEPKQTNTFADVDKAEIRTQQEETKHTERKQELIEEGLGKKSAAWIPVGDQTSVSVIIKKLQCSNHMACTEFYTLKFSSFSRKKKT